MCHAHRRSGQETLFEGPPKVTLLGRILALIDWSVVEAHLEIIHSAPRGEASWKPRKTYVKAYWLSGHL